MKQRMIGLMLVCILCTLTGCQNTVEEEAVVQEETTDAIQIGVSFDSFVIERWQKDRDVFVSTAKDLGAEVNVQNANGEVDEQIAQIEYFIEKKMDVIVIVCVDSESLSDVVKKARGEGIRIVCYDRLIRNANADLYISFDNEMVGSMMAQALVDAGLPNKKVLMLSGPKTDNNVSMVESGFEKIMEENGVEIVDRMNAEGWKAELAGEYINNHIDIVNSVDGIMCGNDNMATSAIRALSERRLAGKTAVVGQDADLEACQHVVENTQVMTVYKPVEKLAERAAQVAVALAKGEDMGETTSIYDGTYDVESIVLEPIAVTKENIDEAIIDSGFHLREEVYLNIPE